MLLGGNSISLKAIIDSNFVKLVYVPKFNICNVYTHLTY